jgi:bacillithiol biosynthesis cysteine-adding enzyme BshC
MTTIRLAVYLTKLLDVRIVPVFWMASEDHDLQEINHAYMLKQDGEIGRARFRWNEEGRPISDLPITENVKRAYDAYWSQVVPGPYTDQTRQVFSYRVDESFCQWQARVWSSLFSSRGLVVVEPHIVRAAAPDFFCFALKRTLDIRQRLDSVARRLTAAGYVPALTSEQAGTLYTFAATGQRVRVENPQDHIVGAAEHPERYSTDAALRPLLADAVFPVIASVLGPGEIAYQAMLKPLYELFRLKQPLLYPRQSYTVITGQETERLAAYQIGLLEILSEQLDLDIALGNLIPAQERELFATAHRQVERALAPLSPYVEGIDPGLARTWTQTVAHATRSLSKLEQRAFKARASQMGFSKGDLRRLQNTLLPRGRPQERVLPLAHFMNRHGAGFIDAMFEAGELGDYRHHVVTMEDGDG